MDTYAKSLQLSDDCCTGLETLQNEWQELERRREHLRDNPGKTSDENGEVLLQAYEGLSQRIKSACENVYRQTQGRAGEYNNANKNLKDKIRLQWLGHVWVHPFVYGGFGRVGV